VDPLDLYALIEPLLGFEEARERLYRIFLEKLDQLGVTQVLDIGCGSGRFMELARERGIEVVGIDVSGKMVESARAKGLSCWQMELRELEGEFEAAVAIFDVLNYIPSSQLPSFFAALAQRLRSQGYFLADINTLYGFSEVAQGSLWVDGGNRFAAIDGHFDGERLVTSMVYFTQEGGCYQAVRGRIEQYYHEIHELRFDGLSIVDIDFVALFGEEVDKAVITYQKD